MKRGPSLRSLRHTTAVYRVAALTSPARWVGWVSCVSAFALATAPDTSAMLPGLADPLNLALTSVVYLAPLAAGGAALNAASLRKGGTMLLASSSPRGVQAAQSVAFTSAAVWHLFAYALLAGVLVLRSDVSGLRTAPFAMLPVLAVVLLLLASTVGHLIGDRMGNGSAAPVAAVIVFAWLFLGSLLPPDLRFVAPVFPEIYFQNFLQPDPALLTSIAATGVALVIVGLAVTARHLGRLSLVGAVVLGVLGIVGLSQGSRQPIEVRPPATPTCDTAGSTTLCGWPESRRELARGLGAINEVRRAVAGVLPTPDRYREEGLAPRYGARVQLARAEGDDPVFLAALAITPHLDCKPYDSAPAEAAGEVAAWVLLRTRAEAVNDPDIRAIARAPLPEQRAWVERRLARAEACRS